MNPTHPFSTALTSLLGIRHPVVLAGMAGGPTTPELVAAVSRAGGLGVFGASGMSVPDLRAAIARARELAPGAPIGVNVLLAPPTEGNPDPGQVRAALADLRRQMDLPEEPAPTPPPPGPVDLVRAALEEGVDVVSTGLGDPAPVAELVHAAGVPLMSMVTTVDEARIVVDSGADVVVAQGWEAGGHRSTFQLAPGQGLPSIGTIALVPQMVAAVDVPVVAAGGVMDGRGLAAVMCLGASGAQLGTRFLGAAEAGVPESYRQRMRNAHDTDTRIIRAMSGRPARGLVNDMVDRLEHGPAPLGYPGQSAAWADIRRAAAQAGDAEHITLWAGQAAGLVDDTALGAEAIVERIIAEALAALSVIA